MEDSNQQGSIVLIAQGNSEDEALNNALNELNLSIDQVEVESLDMKWFVQQADELRQKQEEALDTISEYIYKAIIQKYEQEQLKNKK